MDRLHASLLEGAAARATPWNGHARRWRLVGTPLRPARSDIAIYEDAVGDWRRSHARAPRALLLGVTPEIATMRWPAATTLLALDLSLPMLSQVWPAPAYGVAACADWREPPLADASRDVALGDGSLTVLAAPQGYRRFSAALRRVLAADGLLVLRCYCRPAKPEPLARVFGELCARRIGSFDAFKWRLAMALQADLAGGVRLADVWERWAAEVQDPEALARHCGWPAEVVQGIDNYRGLETRYTFPTLDEVKNALAPEFRFQSQHFGDYELAERCPILVFAPR